MESRRFVDFAVLASCHSVRAPCMVRITSSGRNGFVMRLYPPRFSSSSHNRSSASREARINSGGQGSFPSSFQSSFHSPSANLSSQTMIGAAVRLAAVTASAEVRVHITSHSHGLRIGSKLRRSSTCPKTASSVARASAPLPMFLRCQSFRVRAEVDVDCIFPPTSTFALLVVQFHGAFVIPRETFGFLVLGDRLETASPFAL
jgi:hypothetical protein